MLADYVLALLKQTATDDELKAICKSQLPEFLNEATNHFVDELFKKIHGGGFLVEHMSTENTIRTRYEQEEDEDDRDARQSRDRGKRSNNRDVQVKKERCNSYDQKGYCLQGDLCPFEHGADRIVMDRSNRNNNSQEINNK